MWFIQDYLPIGMFLTLACLLFSGYPVAFICGLALLYGLVGYSLGVFSLIEFFNFLPRIWGQAAENGAGLDPCVRLHGHHDGAQRGRRGLAVHGPGIVARVPGALALAVTIMGTILAAMTGIIGASVTMMTALALPTMMRQGYSHALACGTIAASGTLGILIPPSIMLIIMADLMSVSVGNVYMAAWGPGLALVALYVIFVVTLAAVKPSLAPPLPPDLLHVPRAEFRLPDTQGIHPAGLSDRADQGLDPVRLGHPERGGRGRRVRRHFVGLVQRPPQPQHHGERLPVHGAHRGHDLLHHHQRDVLRICTAPWAAT